MLLNERLCKCDILGAAKGSMKTDSEIALAPQVVTSLALANT